MKTILYSVLFAGLLLVGCGEKKPAAKTPAATNESNASGNPLTAPVDYLGAINQAQKVAVKTIDITSVRQAINFFNANEERNPTDLNELVSKKYIGRLPVLPSGMQYQYDPNSGQVQVVKQQ